MAQVNELSCTLKKGKHIPIDLVIIYMLNMN